MKSIDLNADTGEADNADWLAVESAVMGHITSANIACGGHAGDDDSMECTIRLARTNGVTIGAHPAYPDRGNFGRKSWVLGRDISSKALANTLTSQITRLSEIAARNGCEIRYVKAHGALYNDAVFDSEKAHLIAETVAKLDSSLWLMGAPDSHLTKAAKSNDLKFIAEGFVDRRYTDEGHLQSRTETGAVIASQTEREKQAVALWQGHPIPTASGGSLKLNIRTLCLHSDSPGADKTAAQIRQSLVARGARIKAFTHAR